MNSMPLKVTMFVLNDCTHDARVLKEAKTLSEAGFQVRIIALKTPDTDYFEKRDGFMIERIFGKGDGFVARNQVVPKNTKNASQSVKENKRSYEDKNTKKPEVEPKLIDKVYKKVKVLPYFIKKFFIKGTLKIIGASPLNPKSISFSLAAFRAAKKNPSDFYHAHDLNTLLAGYLAKKRLGGKLIYDSHELYVERNTLPKPTPRAKKVVGLLEGFLLKSVDQVITVNKSIAKELKKRYKIKLPAVVMNTPKYNLVEKPKSLRLELGIPAGEKIIIYSGSITFNRGLEQLIESLQYLENYVLVLMGFGRESYLEELRMVAHKAKVENRLYFFGPVPHEEVPVYVAGADVGAAPIINASLSYYLCSPNKLFEFIQAGIPAIGSNFPELSAVIEGYKIGYTFDPEDPKNIAETIQKVFEDPKKYQQMKKNTREAAKIYNWEREQEKLLKVYSDLKLGINPSRK